MKIEPAATTDFVAGRSVRVSGMLWPLICLAAYVALEWLSDMRATRGVPVVPWNPGLGLLFGVMVLRSPGYGLVLGAGYVIAERLIIGAHLPAVRIAAVACILGAGYGLMAWLLGRNAAFDRGLERLRDVVILLAGGLIAAALVSAPAVHVLGGDGAAFPGAFVSLFVGDAIGIAIFAPILLRLARRFALTRSLRALMPSLDLIAIAAAVLVLLGALHAALGEGAMRFIFLLFVPIVLGATRHGIDGACLTLAAAQFGLILILNVANADQQTFLEVQAEMLVMTMTALIVGVVISERESLNAAAIRTAARLKGLQIEADQAARISLAGGMSSALAHEINQPITAARALARSARHLLGREPPHLDRAARNLDDMVSQIDHAASIIRRMREFLQRGRPHVSTIEMADLLANAIALVGAEARAAGIDLRVRPVAALPPLFGDRTQLEQVLLNLIRNAIEAIQGERRPGGTIEVGAAPGVTPDQVEVFVADSGPGVTPEMVGQLFEPTRSSKENGLGLGLAISGFIIQNHRGRIWLASNGGGRTEFRFAIPLDAGRTD